MNGGYIKGEIMNEEKTQLKATESYEEMEQVLKLSSLDEEIFIASKLTCVAVSCNA